MDMKHLQSDMPDVLFDELHALQTLPRPVYGHAQGLPNRAIGYRHSHAWVQLSYAVKGVITVATDNGRYVAPPFYAVWVPAREPHSVQCSRDTEIRSLYIAPAAVRNLISMGPHCRVLVVTPLMRELIRRFAGIPVEYDIEGADGRLVTVLIDELSRAPEIELKLPWPQDTRLCRICAFLQAHPDSQKGLVDFSRENSISERTLIRLFLQQTGLSFRLWRQRARLLHALPLLEQGDRVTDVALACGYESMSAFIAAFRDQLGVTPGEFGSNHS